MTTINTVESGKKFTADISITLTTSISIGKFSLFSTDSLSKARNILCRELTVRWYYDTHTSSCSPVYRICDYKS